MSDKIMTYQTIYIYVMLKVRAINPFTYFPVPLPRN